MQKIIIKYGIAFHIILIGIFSLGSLFAGGAVNSATPLFWLSLIALEFGVLIPSVRRDEDFALARSRVRMGLLWDPLLYLSLASLIGLLVQFWNSGCKLVYDTSSNLWKMGDPPLPNLPFAVESGFPLQGLLVLFSVFAVALLIRNCIGNSSRSLILNTLAIFSGSLAWVMGLASAFFTREQLGLPPPVLEVAGCAFGFWAIFSLGLFAREGAFYFRLVLLALGVGGNLAGLLLFSSPLTMLLGGGLFILGGLLLFIFLWNSSKMSNVVRFAAVSILLLFAFLALVRFSAQGNPVREKISLLSSGDEAGKEAKTYALPSFWKTFSSEHAVRSEASISIFKDYPWFGVGKGGFASFVGLYIQDESAWEHIDGDRSTVMNEFLQMLVEGGLVGTTLSLALIFLLFAPLACRTYGWFNGSCSRGGRGGGSAPFPPSVLAGYLALLLLFLVAGFERSLSAPAILVPFVTVLSCLASFLPRPLVKTVEDVEDGAEDE